MMAKKEKVKTHYKREFKDFISKGNVIDLAVAVVIGGAFGKIITSLVNGILLQLIAWIFGGEEIFADLYFVIPGRGQYTVTEEVAGVATEVIKSGTQVFYGQVIQAVVEFFLIALFIFLLLVFILKRKQYKEKWAAEQAALENPPAPPAPPADIVLLTEIRDTLKEIKEKESNKVE